MTASDVVIVSYMENVAIPAGIRFQNKLACVNLKVGCNRKKMAFQPGETFYFKVRP